jgi:hypothetical protein
MVNNLTVAVVVAVVAAVVEEGEIHANKIGII